MDMECENNLFRLSLSDYVHRPTYKISVAVIFAGSTMKVADSQRETRQQADEKYMVNTPGHPSYEDMNTYCRTSK